MKIHNTLTKKIEDIIPLNEGQISIYSCGPTVYDRVHIGNLASFIYADTLRRVLNESNLQITHVMNYTDIDDKTIARSKDMYPNESPMDALKKLTEDEINNFNNDINKVGIDLEAIKFIKATDSINDMQILINQLLEDNIAYIAEDGIYFSIDKYKDTGKIYGQLSSISNESTGSARINNDEYDKTSVHDFALWKFSKQNEPSWDYTIEGNNYKGRPGWHIECSAMSQKILGTPFDIHTGGIDLIFPHHENEIAQSTASNSKDKLANIFVHNEHLLIDNRKMSKSLNNVYTLEDLMKKNFNPLALRMLVLQAHYRSILHFSWENLEAAQNRLDSYQAMADLVWQVKNADSKLEESYIQESLKAITQSLQNDMNTPEALKLLSDFEHKANQEVINEQNVKAYRDFIDKIDELFGFQLKKEDVSHDIKELIEQRENARENKDYEKADKYRNQLQTKGISVRDTDNGSIWSRI